MIVWLEHNIVVILMSFISSQFVNTGLIDWKVVSSDGTVLNMGWKNDFVCDTIVRDDGDNLNTIQCEHEATKDVSADNEKPGILPVVPIKIKI